VDAVREGLDAWTCLGEPCLRRKYRRAPGLESGRAARIWRVGDGDGDEVHVIMMMIVEVV